MGQATLVYDNNCTFCTAAVGRWRLHTGDAVRYLALAQAKATLSPEQCAACTQAIHLFMPDGRTFRAAHAVLMIWVLGGRRRWLLWLYEHVPPFAAVAETVYRFVSQRRLTISRWFA